MGELQSVKTVQLSVRPLFRPNTGPSGGARSTHGAPTATLSGFCAFLRFFIFACHLLAGMATVVKQASKQASNVFRLISLLACYRRQWTGAES